MLMQHSLQKGHGLSRSPCHQNTKDVLRRTQLNWDCNLSPWKVKIGGSNVQGHTGLYNHFKASLACMRPCFKTLPPKNQQQNKTNWGLLAKKKMRGILWVYLAFVCCWGGCCSVWPKGKFHPAVPFQEAWLAGCLVRRALRHGTCYLCQRTEQQAGWGHFNTLELTKEFARTHSNADRRFFMKFCSLGRDQT